MSDDDLIRRGDALAAVKGWMPHEKAIAAIPAVTVDPVAAPDPALRPTMTDMMVDPDTLDAFMEANPLPPDPAAIREAAHDLVGFLDGKHASYMAAKGRDPKEYVSGWSIARDKAATILALISTKRDADDRNQAR